MHIPDGFLSPPVWITMSVVSAACVGVSLRKSSAALSDRDVPTLGMMGAFIFAAQMVNFPVAAGTSGHLLGGALAVAVLGPWAATVVMAAVIIVQALFLHDGGITALGANLFNMAVLGPWLAWAVLGTQRSQKTWLKVFAGFFAGWLSTVVTALGAGLEIGVSGTAPLRLLLPAILFWHILIGVGEGAITAAILLYLERADKPLFRTLRGQKRAETVRNN